MPRIFRKAVAAPNVGKVHNPSLILSPEEYFEQQFNSLVRPEELVLDAGCGSGKFSPYRNAGYRILGLDNFENVHQNTKLNVRVCGNVNNLPFRDGSFDAVYGRWMVEHLENPAIALREFHRVLKQGGRLALFTTNLWHYYGVTARVTPQWFHVWFNCRVRGFEQADIFPTYYRANTRKRCNKLLREAGFSESTIEISLVEGSASVLNFNFILHRLGIVYEYVVRRFEALSSFRMNLIAIARKD